MSNYNSSHTGAEIDAAVSSVLEGGTLNSQVATNTSDIAELGTQMESIESQLVVLDDLEEIQDELGSTDTYPFSSFLTDDTYWSIGSTAAVGGTYLGRVETFTTHGVYFRQPEIITLEAGWKIQLSVEGGSGARGWAVCDMNDVILDVCPVNTSYLDTPYEYTASGPCKVYVNTKGAAGSITVLLPQSKLDMYLEDYEDFKEETAENFSEVNTALGKEEPHPFSDFSDPVRFWNIGANAVVGDTYTGGTSTYSPAGTFNRIPDVLNLSAGDRIVLAVNGGNASRGWAICDTNNVILDVCPVNTSYLNSPYEYTATQDCKVYVNTKGTAGSVVIYHQKNAIERMQESVVVSTSKIYNPTVDVVQRQSLRVLDIGNSFSVDSMSYLADMVEASGIDTTTFALYQLVRGGGSFKTFYDSWHNQDDYSGEVGCHYSYKRIAGYIVGIEGDSALERMHYIIKNAQWDIIVIHNRPYGSLSTDDWEGNGDNGYLKEFVRILRLYNPTAAIGFMMPHASHRDSPDTVEGWTSICETIRWMQTHYGVDFVIPVGTAIENLRASSLKTVTVAHEFSRDNHHLGFGLARYVANAAYFQTVIAPRYGVSVFGNSAVHAVSSGEMSDPSYLYPGDCVDVTNANKGLAQLCAVCACDDMFTITPPDGIEDTL